MDATAPGFSGAQRGIIQAVPVDILCGPGRRRRIRRVVAGCEHIAGNRAVQRAGIEMNEAVALGQLPAQRAFAGCRGTIEGDDHPFVFLPGADVGAQLRISAVKPVKLVAIMEASSMETGAFAASPITRKAMAMRWSIWVAMVPPPGTDAGARNDQRIALNAVVDTTGGQSRGG